MRHRLRPRSIYDVFALLALIVAIGGTGAYAANTITSSDIMDGEVASVDVKDQDIRSADVKDESLTTFDVSTFLGADVVDGTLTGADVQDNSLGIADIGSQSVGADEVLNNSLLSSDLSTDSVGGDEVQNDSLTGTDINESTLVGVRDSCPGGTVLLGRLCVGGDGVLREWLTAAQFCAASGLRLPTTGESLVTAQNYNIPAIADTDYFWTDDVTGATSITQRALVSDNAGFFPYNPASTAAQTICVATPTDA